MTHPGRRLRAIAARWCSTTTLERLIDPAIADLQIEYADAIDQHRVWKSRFVLMAGYGAFLKVVAAGAWGRLGRTCFTWTDDEQRALRCVVGWTVAATSVGTLLLTGPFWRAVPTPLDASRASILVLLVPQALPISLPVGFTLGILFGLRNHINSTKMSVLMLTIAGACCGACLVMLAWVVPSANQTFREAVYGGPLPKTLTELTLTELAQRVDTYASVGQPAEARRAAMVYHSRLALSCSGLTLALFALSATRRRRVGRVAASILACGAVCGYYALMPGGGLFARADALPSTAVLVAAWLPNLGLVAMSTLAFVCLPPSRPSYA